jgi:L-fucose dehydrogenase
MRFKDRVVLITGGAKGIGAGCVEVFAAEGAKIAIVDRDMPCARSLANRYPRNAIAIEADVGHADQIQQAIETTIARFGQLDCLINNAGIHPPATPIESMSPHEAMQVMQVNFMSTYAGSHYAMKYLRATRGTIINISSMTAVLGQLNSTAYAASKGAQLAFTKALALEAAADGIRVNAILPSNIDTPLMRAWAATLPDPAAALARIAALQPLGRMGTPHEIGKVCLFLATEDSSFITGQGIEVDGGAALDY